MHTSPRLTFSARYNRMLLKVVRFAIHEFFNMEKIIMRRTFIREFQPRQDDVCVVTYMRSGTTLLQMMLYQLLTDGSMNFRHLSDVSPLLEDFVSTGRKMDHLPSPRIFKTHGDYKYFPQKTSGQIIYVVRNGMDVASSMFHYYKNYNMPNLEWDDFLNRIFMNRISWFKHVADWMENKHCFNICYIQYEDITRDPRQTIQKLSSFLHVNPTEDVIQRVLERCTFSYMKEHEKKFARSNITSDKPDTYFIRRGEPNKGRLEFNQEQREKFVRLYNTYLGKYNLGYDFSAVPLPVGNQAPDTMAV